MPQVHWVERLLALQAEAPAIAALRRLRTLLAFVVSSWGVLRPYDTATNPAGLAFHQGLLEQVEAALSAAPVVAAVAT